MVSRQLNHGRVKSDDEDDLSPRLGLAAATHTWRMKKRSHGETGEHRGPGTRVATWRRVTRAFRRHVNMDYGV